MRAAAADARRQKDEALLEAEAARQQAVAAAAVATPPNTHDDEATRAWLSKQGGGVSAKVEAAATAILAAECDQGVEAARLVQSATARPTALGCSAHPRREPEPSPSP